MLIASLVLSATMGWTPPPDADAPLEVPGTGADQPAPEPPAPPSPPADNSDETKPKRTPPTGLLTPIPQNGGLPLIYNKMYDLTREQIAYRAKGREYAQQIRKIRADHFRDIRVAEIRAQGIELLTEFTDPAAFRPMIEELRKEADDVRLAMLDHFAKQGDEGQAALGWLAIYDNNPAIQNEALGRMVSPVGDPVKYLLNGALRSGDHETVSSAAIVSTALNVLETIPLLIFAQADADNPGAADDQGDLAWIAIQTQRAYVQNLVPVVGDSAGAFQPIMGIVSEGVVMRIVDAVVIEYRTIVHNSLVAMTTSDWGQPTDDMGYNVRAWWDWYNDVYVPFKNEQALADKLGEEPPVGK